jgi:hypothetical protein
MAWLCCLGKLIYDGVMNPQVFSLQQRVAYTLLDRLETREMSWDRAVEISKRVLEIIPDNEPDISFASVAAKLELIPELMGLSFGLEEEAG